MYFRVNASPKSSEFYGGDSVVVCSLFVLASIVYVFFVFGPGIVIYT